MSFKRRCRTSTSAPAGSRAASALLAFIISSLIFASASPAAPEDTKTPGGEILEAAPQAASPLFCLRTAAEDGPFTIACDPPGVIASVPWARYGRPTALTATCNYRRDPACDADVTPHFSACPGRQSCTVVTGNSPFGGDPCHNSPKWTAAVFTCTTRRRRSPRNPPTRRPAPRRPRTHSAARRSRGAPRTASPGPSSCLNSLRAHAGRAPGRPPGPEGQPFDCIPKRCLNAFAGRRECTRLSADTTEAPWVGGGLTLLGTRKGWVLGWGDIAIGVSVKQTLFARLDAQVSSGGRAGGGSFALPLAARARRW